MADKKITNLPELSLSGLSSDDVMPIVDITTDDTNKVTLNNLKNYITSDLSDVFTTGATYNNTTALATFTRNDGNTYTLDLSSIDVNDTFVTGSSLSGTTLLIDRNNGESQITVDLSSLSDNTNLGNILYVSENGDDSSAQKGNLHKPWRNLYSAKSASTSGDTVYVLPGTWTYDNSSLFYNGQVDTLVNLWKDGVTYYFSPNTKIELINIGGVASDSMYLFSPKGTTGETCTVLGHLDFEQTSSGANSGGHNYFYYNNEPAFSTDGSTFYAEVKKLTSHHSPILGIEGINSTSVNQTNLTIISEEEYHDYVGGNSAAGSFYYIKDIGNNSTSNNINLYSKYRNYNGDTSNIPYGFYLRGNCSNANINIGGERVFCNATLIYQLFPKGEFNINIKDIHYGTLTVAGLSGVVLNSYPLNSTDDWTLNLNGNLYDDSPNSSTKGLFYMYNNSINGTVNYKGNITTNTSTGSGRFIVSTGTNSSNINANIDGDITFIGSGTTTRSLFEGFGTNTKINYKGRISGSFASGIARPRNGATININNSFIESEVDGATSSVFVNNSTVRGTGRLNNSYVRLTNNTNGVLDGEDNNIFINNSTIINLGTGSTISFNTTNNGDLQILNSTLISSFSGATGILYNGSTNVISSNTTVSNPNNINNLLGNIIVLTDLTT